MALKKESIKMTLSIDDRNRLVSFVMLLMEVDKRVNKDKKTKSTRKSKSKTKITSIKARLGSEPFYFSVSTVSFMHTAFVHSKADHDRYDSSSSGFRFFSGYEC